MSYMMLNGSISITTEQKWYLTILGLTVDEAVVYINDRAHGCVKMINAVQNSSLIDNSSLKQAVQGDLQTVGQVIGWMQSVIQLSQIPFTAGTLSERVTLGGWVRDR